jgi:hypothetical protein
MVLTEFATVWKLHTEHHRATPRQIWETLGLIPAFLHGDDPRPAVTQLAERYGYGWYKLPSDAILVDGCALKCPGDPLLYPLATCGINGERVMVYECAFVGVVHADRTYEFARLD